MECDIGHGHVRAVHAVRFDGDHRHRRGESAYHRHAQFHQHQIGMVQLILLDGFPAVRGLSGNGTKHVEAGDAAPQEHRRAEDLLRDNHTMRISNDARYAATGQSFATSFGVYLPALVTSPRAWRAPAPAAVPPHAAWLHSLQNENADSSAPARGRNSTPPHLRHRHCE